VIAGMDARAAMDAMSLRLVPIFMDLPFGSYDVTAAG
jgi:hypothetical protein